MKKKVVGWIAAGVVVALAAALCLLGRSRNPRAGEEEAVASAAEKGGVQADRGKSHRKDRQPPAGGARAKREKIALDLLDDEDEDDTRTPAEKALAARIEKAYDDEDLEAARACAKDALYCGNVEIRQAMVDALGWFGEKALAELTPFMADPDEDVRESAMNEWQMAVSEIEDEAEKLGLVEVAMNILSDEDVLEDISGEYIGVDEKLAVESLVRLIGANGSAAGVAKAKETYEFVTGEEWTSPEAAAKWIAEEYQPPEPEPPAKDAGK